MTDENHKPIIETIINTSALALTSYGVIIITTNGDWQNLVKGLILITFGATLEFLKYYGRKKQLW